MIGVQATKTVIHCSIYLLVVVLLGGDGESWHPFRPTVAGGCLVQVRGNHIYIVSIAMMHAYIQEASNPSWLDCIPMQARTAMIREQ